MAPTLSPPNVVAVAVFIECRRLCLRAHDPKSRDGTRLSCTIPCRISFPVRPALPAYAGGAWSAPACFATELGLLAVTAVLDSEVYLRARQRLRINNLIPIVEHVCTPPNRNAHLVLPTGNAAVRTNSACVQLRAALEHARPSVLIATELSLSADESELLNVAQDRANVRNSKRLHVACMT
jgi:hypothetical protein